MRESAGSAKRSWFMFGAKPAQSETPVRAHGQAAPTRKRRSGKEDAELPREWYLGGTVLRRDACGYNEHN